jgi:hypothetical protein
VNQLDAIQAVEDGALNAPRIEKLTPQEVKIRTRRTARRGNGTGPGRQGRASRIVVRLEASDATLY